jgi:YggT family protein
LGGIDFSPILAFLLLNLLSSLLASLSTIPLVG